MGEAVYLNLINKAERYVYAMTPYLIISDSVNTALCNAAKSGVDVRIITPHIPDKALVFELTRSHYESLLEAGVQIFEYTPGFVHAKVMVTDDCCGVVGSINLDYRSMFLHFEDAVLLYHDPTVLDIKRDFINTQFRSQPVTLEQCLGHSWIRRLFRSILRCWPRCCDKIRPPPQGAALFRFNPSPRVPAVRREPHCKSAPARP